MCNIKCNTCLNGNQWTDVHMSVKMSFKMLQDFFLLHYQAHVSTTNSSSQVSNNCHLLYLRKQ